MMKLNLLVHLEEQKEVLNLSNYYFPWSFCVFYLICYLWFHSYFNDLVLYLRSLDILVITVMKLFYFDDVFVFGENILNIVHLIRILIF
jgi:SET domain-containing protein